MTRTRPPGRAWRETELDDDGELVQDARPVRCPRCQHPTDLGGLDDIAVHRCHFCQKRTRYLWSDRRGLAVPEFRGPNPDWGEEDEWYLWSDYEPGHEYDDSCEEQPCANGCVDPVFGGPAGEVEERGRWVCAVCGAGEEAEEEF